MKKLFWLIPFLYSLVVNAQEASMKFKHITVDDGLTHNYIKTLHKDSTGYLWIGMGNSGVDRYDGYNFRSYKYNSSDTNTISNNTINVIYEDFEHNIWVCTQGGLNLYDREQDIFKRIPTTLNNIVGIHRLKSGEFLLLTESNIYSYDQSKAELEKLNNQLESTASDYYSGTFLYYSENQIYIPTAKGIIFYNPSEKKFEQVVENKTLHNGVTEMHVRTLFKDSRGKIWAGTENDGAFVIEMQNNKPVYVQHFINEPENQKSINKGSILSIEEDKNGNVLFGNFLNGVDMLPATQIGTANPTFYHYSHDGQDAYSLAGNSVNYLLVDEEGTLWVGTFNGGVDYYNPVVFKFNHVRNNPDVPNGLNSNNVNVIYGNNKYLWIATDLGLNRFDPLTDTWTHFTYDPANPKGITASGIWALTADNEGNMWIGMWAGGINMYDEQTNSFIQYWHDPSNPTSISSNNVFGLTVDEDGTIWVASMGGGLNIFNPETGVFRSFKSDGSGKGISTNWTKIVLVTQFNEVWVASGSGINVFDKQTEEFTRFQHSDEDAGSISHNGIVALLEDSKGTIWVGTEYGINRFNRSNGTFTVYTEEDGLANNVVRAIQEDREGNLWISTNKGLSKFVSAVNKPENKEFKNYYSDDGLQADAFQSRCSYKDKDGNLYFGGSNGFNVFNPSNISMNPNTPRVILSNFQIFNKEVPIGTEESPLSKHISLTKEIEISYKEAVLRFEYVALNLLVPEKNEYAYKMEGFEDEWNYVGSQKFATYTNLDPGEYTFRVKGSNNDGVWNEEGAALKIIITPPFWKTWWFITIATLFVAFIVYMALRARQKQVERDKKILEEKIQAGEKELEAQKAILQEKDEMLRKKIESEKEQKWFNEGMIKVSDILRDQKNDLGMLSERIISELTKYIGVQQGAMYLAETDETGKVFLKVRATYGADKSRMKGTKIEEGEGKPGTCFKERKVFQIDNLPDGFATMYSGLGKTNLRNLTLVPIQLNENIIGLFEFLSVKKLEPFKIEFIQKAGETLTSILASIKSKDDTNKVAQQQKELAEKLMSQEEELRQNIEEMEATREEAARKVEMLEKALSEAKKREVAHLALIKDLEDKSKS